MAPGGAGTRIEVSAPYRHSDEDVATVIQTEEGLVVFTHAWWKAELPVEDPYAPDPERLHESRARILGLSPALIVPGHARAYDPVASIAWALRRSARFRSATADRPGRSGAHRTPTSQGDQPCTNPISPASWASCMVMFLPSIEYEPTAESKAMYLAPREFGAQPTAVVAPGFSVIELSLVVYVPDMWLQSTLAPKVPSLFSVSV
jgi:glyoxylase-like metal-dependent hydrolase (beta-lactamase superfamily II)